MDVEPIRDQLAGDRRVVEDGAEHAGLAVVQRAHAVEDVGRVARARLDRRRRLLVGRIRVGERGDRAGRHDRLDDRQGTRQLRRERDEPDGARGEQRAELAAVGRAQVLGLLRAAALLAEPRPLEGGRRR